MAGLPHYKNSKAAVNNWEPVYYANFEVMITPPAGISDWDLVMENIISVGGIDLTKGFPTPKYQKYKNYPRAFVGGAITDPTQEIELSFEVNLNDANSMYVYKAIRQWCNLAYDPLTGKMGLKKEYSGGPMTIVQFNANGDIFRQLTFPNVIPGSMVKGPDEYDWSSEDIFKVEEWKLIATYWDETIL